MTPSAEVPVPAPAARASASARPSPSPALSTQAPALSPSPAARKPIASLLNDLRARVDANRKAVAEMKALFSEIDAERKARDALTAQVRALKDKKAPLAVRVKKLGAELDAVSEKLKHAERPRFPYALLARRLEELEWLQQTEAVTARLEKEFSKQIRVVRDELAKADALAPVRDESRKLRAEFRDALSQLRDVVFEMRRLAAASQTHHERAFALQKKVDGLKKSVREGFAAVDALRASLDREREALAKLDAERARHRTGRPLARDRERHAIHSARQRDVERQLAVVKEKAKVIFDAFKKGKKITLDEMRILDSSGLL